MAKRLVVIGGGFAGLWAAASAARLRAQAGREADLEIMLIAPSAFHIIRVRCYENDISGIRVPLDEVLAPLGIRREQARVDHIEPGSRALIIRREGQSEESFAYDGLVLAAGSTLAWPDVPGLVAHGFDVDTYEGAARLARHLAALPVGRSVLGAGTAIVLGAGLVGIELACELPSRLRAIEGLGGTPIRVLLLERGAAVAADMGAGRPAILEGLEAAGVEIVTQAALSSVDATGVVLGTGAHIPAATVVCATGMRASALAADLGGELDRLGRILVDDHLAVPSSPGVYAAGDAASAQTDTAGHRTVMSCQHARPMGRIAGHNAACDLLDLPGERIAFAAPDYVTCLDLGPSGAVYTAGWSRDVLVASGAQAKRTKETINRLRIYPPPGGDRAAILAAAAPVIQARPSS